MISYSIIIPHFNIPQLLERCLKSIPDREDIQVIVVDDCSSEDSIAKLKLVESAHPNVKFVYLEKNMGGGAARNAGLKNAVGKYVVFADSDDFFNPSFNDILDKYKDKDFDLAFLGAGSVDSETFLPTHRALYLNKLFKIYRFFPGYGLKLLKYAFGEPWSKIISLDMIQKHSISFDEIRIHNDTRFSYETAFYSRRIIVDSTPVYCVTERANSVSKAISDDKQLARIDVFAEKNMFLKKNGIKYVDEQVYYPFVYYWKAHNSTMLNKCFGMLKEKGYCIPYFRCCLVKYYLIRRLKDFVKRFV